MPLSTDNPLLHGFGPSVRTMWLTADSLEVKRTWNPPSASTDSSPSAGAEALSWISGVARLERAKLAIIGNENSAASTLKLILTGNSQEDIASEWREIVQNRGDWFAEIAPGTSDLHRAELIQFARNIYERFDDSPPNVSIYHDQRDRENNVEEGWTVVCQLSAALLETIVADIYLKRCQALEFRYSIAPTLIDHWLAPHSVDATYGVLPLGKGTDGTCHGYVTGVSWRTSGTVNTEAVHGREFAADSGPDTGPETGQLATQESSPVVLEIARLSRTVRLGFIVVFLLISALVILR